MLDRAAILSTGDELTTGRIVDTNANYLADKLFELGIDVTAVLTVGDYPDRLEWAWRQAIAQADLVISTGGIGPTADDLTNETVARVAGVPLVLHAESAERIRGFFAAAKRPMPENNLRQAMVPEGAVIIPNPLGTAPGYRLAVGQSHLVVLPGVPREMKRMMEDVVLPWVRTQRGGEVYLSRVFQTFGVTESGLDQLVAGVVRPDEGRLCFRASFPEVCVRLVVHGPPDEAARRLDEVGARVRERLGACVYGEGAVTMQEVAGRALLERKLTVAVAESCTGGLIGHRITEVPGSSAWFRGGVVVYADDLKQRLIGVRAETLARHGAVSEETAAEMAVGVRRALGADLGVAVTGIAGPDGGTPEKPVGTVCFGLARAEGTVTHRYPLWGTRDWVKLLASQVALDWIRRVALGLEVPDSQFFRRR
ncbi:MAG TPA: competence/damage-inducible protein A [Candidatus Limnocylindria bacterium]|nr:competence/damage-inducible protein A [Candidatus Limnocylindria bacterium]